MFRLQIFLCHASEDKAPVRRLYKDLKRCGFSPWLDSEDIVGGQDWDAEIQRAVRSSHVVLVCLSTHSITKTGYVQKEIRIALDAAEHHPEGQIYIVPLRLCPCDIPARLTRFQAIDFFMPGGMSRLERSLLTRCFMGGLWISSDDDPSSSDRDMASLVQMQSSLKSLLPPTADEELKELAESVAELKKAADLSSLRALCISSRAILAHLPVLALQEPLCMRKSVAAAARLLNESLKALARVTDKRAESYVNNIRARATLVERLRRQFR